LPFEILSQLLATHPHWIDAASIVYLVGFIVAHGLRAGWPDEQWRPRAVVIALAFADACQLVFTAPVKAIARKVR